MIRQIAGILVIIFSLMHPIQLAATAPAPDLMGQEQFDVTFYRIALAIFPPEEKLAGSVVIRAKSTVDGLTEIILDLYNTMAISSITGNVGCFSHNNDFINVELDRAYYADEVFEIEIHYSGKPERVELSSGGNFNPFLFVHTRRAETVCSESCPYYARAWWPCKDTPSDKPDSVHLAITIPEDLDLAASGKFIGTNDNQDGTATHYWHVLNPIATYLIAIQITDYARLSEKYVSASGDSMDLLYYVFPEDCTLALANLKKIRKMLDVLSHYFGEYPYLNEKYAMVEYLGAWAAMEYQTLSCFNSSFIADEMTALHELAHQWYGDCVTPRDFRHSWVSEGFAVYAEALYLEYDKGIKRYHSYMNNSSNALSFTGRIYRDDISSPYTVYDLIVYDKGAWVLHMLRRVLGDAVFFQAIREYRYRFEYGSATTEDLQTVCEEVSGKDLQYFFRQWIYDYWHPEYVLGWNQRDMGDGTFLVTGFIDQQQTLGPLFSMPVDITIETGAGDTTFTQFVDEQGESFEISVLQQPLKVILDRDGWILKEVSEINKPVIIYDGYMIDDSNGNGNLRPDPGETVTMAITLNNTGLPLAAINATLSTGDPAITIVTDHAEFGQLNHRQPGDNQASPFRFSVDASALGHLAEFQLSINGDGGYAVVLPVDVKIGKAPALFIDDDQGKGYENYFVPIFDKIGVYADVYVVAAPGIKTAAFSEYQTLIWATGDSRDSTLTASDIDSLKRFLDRGGSLILTGQNIGYDLIENGSEVDSLFYTDYLKAEYVEDNSGALVAYGYGGPIADKIYADFIGAAGAKNQTSPDIISPIEPAVGFMIYLPGNATAAICHADAQKGCRIVYFAFGLEGVGGPQADCSQKILASAVEWIYGKSAVETCQMQSVLPGSYALSQNYPNPFNPETIIDYQIPVPDAVSLKIFNSLGQEVRSLVDEKKAAGFYKLEWDGKDAYGLPVASGVYFRKLQAGQYIQMKKMVMMR
ncbi:T9SS type A sorting domain-containing protein [candidate division KSB1 bacterium]|nr:T9SS type A sorting domain-containing protein [candidate division KSB1 bacterium]